MAPVEKKESSAINPNDLKYILEVNQKAIEIYVNVEKQQDDIIEKLLELKEEVDVLEKQLKEFDEKNDKDHSSDLEMSRITLETSRKINSIVDKIIELQKTSHDSISKNQESIQKTNDTLSDLKKKIEEIDKNLFRLVFVFSGGLISVVWSIVQHYMTKK